MKTGYTLKMHIPRPPARPGDEPNFSDFIIDEAGAVSRPDVDTPDDQMRDMPFRLIRVLDDDHQAVGEWNPGLDADTLRSGLRHMMLTRAFDGRMIKAQRQGKTSFYMQCTGEEACGVAQAYALDADDMLFTSYRQQSMLIARDWPLLDLMCQIFNNTRDRTKGRQLPVLYSAAQANFFSISGNLCTQYPQAVGWAMASAYKGDSRIAATWIGEGTTAESDFHTALTFAAVYQAPVVLNITNNQYAISSFQAVAGGEQSTFAARAIGYGIPGLRVDGNDFLAVYAATQWAAERARTNQGPTLIELYTYRVAAHSSSDDPSAYRSAAEASAWPLGDPIIRLKQHLISLSEWDDQRHAALEKQLDADVLADLKEAEKYGTLGTPPCSPASMFDDVFKELPPHLRRQRQQAGY
ncbi:MAG: thiamine pyrophosphate-dependent enzyme [Oceanococcaceae bacterium]